VLFFIQLLVLLYATYTFSPPFILCSILLHVFDIHTVSFYTLSPLLALVCLLLSNSITIEQISTVSSTEQSELCNLQVRIQCTIRALTVSSETEVLAAGLYLVHLPREQVHVFVVWMIPEPQSFNLAHSGLMRREDFFGALVE